MTRSESIQELATALAKAQGLLEGAKKGTENPHYRHKYADLAAVWDAIREPFSIHGLSLIQSPRLISVGDGAWMVECETLLLHTSGQFVSDTLAIPVTRVDAQGVGSAVTYARRYALMAVAGVAPEDDDGEAAVGSTAEHRAPAKAEPKQAQESGPVKVRGIVQRPTANNSTKYVITASDNLTYASFHKEHAEQAKAAQEAGQSVRIGYVQENWGRKIVSIAEVGAEEPAL